jgi:NleD-like pathogen effector protein (putative zinc metallopeptidase)
MPDVDWDRLVPNVSAWFGGGGPQGAAAPPAAEHGPGAPALGGLAPEAARAGLFSWLFGDDDKKKEKKDDDEPVHPAKKAAELMQKHLEELKKQLEAQKKAAAEEAEKRKKREAEIEEDAKKDPLFKKDPKQARELADARKDLEGMFEVANGKGGKDRKQNQLSPEEMKRITKLYADIKNGRSDLKVAGPDGNDPQKSEEARAKGLKDIARILQTESGRGLVTALANNKDGRGQHHTTTLHSESDVNDRTSTETDAKGNVDVYVPNGQILKVPGTGEKVDWANLARSDVVTYHELCHAFHKTHGDEATGYIRSEAVDPNDTKGVSKAEYQAAGLGDWGPNGKLAKKNPFNENRYREERNGVSDGGRNNDRDLPESLKRQYPGWEKWWSDGKMADRPAYNPEPQMTSL